MAAERAVGTVQIDNGRVRVTEWRFAPGTATGHHRHELDYLVVPLTTGRLNVVTEGGQTVAELATGRRISGPRGSSTTSKIRIPSSSPSSRSRSSPRPTADSRDPLRRRARRPAAREEASHGCAPRQTSRARSRFVQCIGTCWRLRSVPACAGARRVKGHRGASRLRRGAPSVGGPAGGPVRGPPALGDRRRPRPVVGLIGSTIRLSPWAVDVTISHRDGDRAGCENRLPGAVLSHADSQDT